MARATKKEVTSTCSTLLSAAVDVSRDFPSIMTIEKASFPDP